MTGPPRALLRAILEAALEAVDAGRLVEAAVGDEDGRLRIAGRGFGPSARLVVLAAGKAAGAMAAALERRVPERIVTGVAVTKSGHAVALERIEVLEAAHPLPDARSEAAGRRALELAARAGPRDLLLVALSGGASALLACPEPGLSLADVAATTEALLRAGAPIGELNTVRRHLVRVAGGKLVRATRAGAIEVLALSDVPGDHLEAIGSGPCSPDPTRYRDALDVLRRYGLLERVPGAVRARLEAGCRGQIPENPAPGDPVFDRVRTTLLGSNREARRAAVAEARERGLQAIDLGEILRGEASRVGRRLAALGLALAPRRTCCLVAGGETTVTVRGNGRGGRNQELALAAAIELAGRAGVTLLAAGTDGTDGPTDAAGAFADGATVARGAAAGIDAPRALAANDSYRFFTAEGGLLRTGPTRTNVMDLVLLHAESLGAG